MSAVIVDTTNINIAPFDIINMLADRKCYVEYSKEVFSKIALEIIEEYKKAILKEGQSNTAVFDDEELFDEIYDYMLERLDEVFSTADIAYLVNDILIQLEDILFDEGCIKYHS